MKSTTVSKFQAAMAAEVEADEPKRLDIFVNDEDTVQTVVEQIRVRAEDNGVNMPPEMIAEQAASMIGARDGDPEYTADPFVGMQLEIGPDEAYGMIQAKVRGWLDDRAIIAQEDEIRAKTNDLYGAAQSTAPVRDWRRPDPGVATEATYTVSPDGVVGDYQIAQAERELPGMPGHPEAPNADAIAPSMLWDPAVWGKVVDPEGKATLLWDIPQNREFTNGQLKRAIDLDEMVDALIRKVRPLSTLAPLTIGWYWKLKGGRSRGKPVLSRVAVADKTLAYERSYDVVVHLSADHLRKMKASALFVERLVFDALARIDPDGPRVQPDDEWARLPGRWRYGWLGPDERLYCDLVAQIDSGHQDDTTVDLDAPAAVTEDPVQNVMDMLDEDPTLGDDLAHPENYPDPDPMPVDGLLIHEDGPPLTADEIQAQEAAELRDDPAEADLSDDGDEFNNLDPDEDDDAED